MKICFKCNEPKPLSEFYVHSMMADGHLNKCKGCARADSSRREKALKQNPEWMEKERDRSRLKMAKIRAEGREKKATRAQRKRCLDKHALKYPDRNAARIAVGNAIRAGTLTRKPCRVCGNPTAQAHHEDYSKPLVVDWL